MKNICVFTCANSSHIEHAIEMLVSCSRVCTSQIDARVIIDADATNLEQQLNDLHINRMHFKMHYIDMLSKISQKFTANCTGTFFHMAYAKCFAPNLLNDVDKALYLDTDMIAICNFEDIFNNTLDNAYIGACLDLSMILFDKEELQKIKSNYYFNGGTLLWDLNHARNSSIANITEKFVANPEDWFFTKGKEYAEQSILNWAYKNNLKILDPKYNVQAILLGFPQYSKFVKMFGYISENDLIEKCVFAHAQGAKPWNSNWETWQSWQVPLKQFMKDAYIENRNYCQNLGVYDVINKWRNELST